MATPSEEGRMLAEMYEIYLCASTIDGANFQQRLEAACAGGYIVSRFSRMSSGS